MYKNNMKELYQEIRLRIANPTSVDLVVAFLLWLITGNITGEIVSRPVNSYIQASMMILSVFLTIVFLKMIAAWIFNFVTNKNK